MNLYLGGGADTFNLVVPINCALHDEYVAVRGEAALGNTKLLEISSSQACQSFGLHYKLPKLRELYQAGEAVPELQEGVDLTWIVFGFLWMECVYEGLLHSQGFCQQHWCTGPATHKARVPQWVQAHLCGLVFSFRSLADEIKTMGLFQVRTNMKAHG